MSKNTVLTARRKALERIKKTLPTAEAEAKLLGKLPPTTGGRFLKEGIAGTRATVAWLEARLDEREAEPEPERVPQPPKLGRKAKRANGRPPKPHADFPLGPSTNGYWQKRIKGKLLYFGRWGDVVKGKLVRRPGDGADEALAAYQNFVNTGHKEKVQTDGLLVKDLCNRFLTAKKHLLTTGEIAARTFAEYTGTTDRLIRVFGGEQPVENLTADDFEALRADIATTRGPVALGNEIQRVRSVFKLAYDNGLIDKPIRYGQGFKKPSRKVLRKAKATNGHRMFDAAEIRLMLDKATPALKAMILLGVNCGFGNADCGTLPKRAVNLDAGWINYPRPKTGIDRRCPIWPETVKAMRAALAERPTPKDKAHADLFFITSYGDAWAKDTPDSPVARHTGMLLDDLDLHRPGLGFYTLRHVFRTVADGTRDFPAIDLIMGHADNSMAAHYREHIDDARLKAVTDHVRAWLYSSPAEKTEGGAA